MAKSQPTSDPVNAVAPGPGDCDPDSPRTLGDLSTDSEGDTLSDGETLSEGLTDSEGDTLSDGDTLSEGLTDSEGDTLSDGETLSLGLGQFKRSVVPS
jgi:hypothetical protein